MAHDVFLPFFFITKLLFNNKTASVRPSDTSVYTLPADELNSVRQTHLLDEEPESVEPREQHLPDRGVHPFLLELERLRTHDGGVDEVEPQSICTVFIDDFHRVCEKYKTWRRRSSR